MAQEILTGNVLVDGVTYHATDINAAINNATVQPAVIEDKALTAVQAGDKFLLSRNGALGSTNMASVALITRTNLVTSGNANIAQGISLSGFLNLSVTGNQNDFNPANFATATFLSLGGTGVTITGMLAPAVVGTLKIIFCSSGTIILTREDSNSQAANRLTWHSGNPLTLAVTESATFIYNNSRWILLATSHGI